MSILSFSQDNHYTMFYKTPIMLNPANTGNFDGKWRINSTFRNQGEISNSAYNSAFVSFDMPVFYFNRLGSFGLSASNNNSAGGTLVDKQFQLSTAHFVKITQNSYLHIGFSFSLVNKSLASEGLTFPNQFDNSIGMFNPSFENYENFSKYNIWYLDLSTGLMWSRFTEKNKTQIGFAMFHYNQPEVYFFNDETKLKARYQFHFYNKLNIGTKIYLKPKLLYSYQSAASEMLVGLNFGTYILDAKLKEIYTGLFTRTGINRNTDAALFSVGFIFDNCSLNFSYEYSLIFNKANYCNDTTFEISFFYKLPRLTVDKRAIQCEIF